MTSPTTVLKGITKVSPRQIYQSLHLFRQLKLFTILSLSCCRNQHLEFHKYNNIPCCFCYGYSSLSSSSSFSLPFKPIHKQISQYHHHHHTTMTKRKIILTRREGSRRSSRLRMATKDDSADRPKQEKEMNDNQSSKSNKKKKVTMIQKPSSKKVKKDIVNDYSSSNNVSMETKRRDPSMLLLDLGDLVKGELVKRPSSKIKSPYVADVKIFNNGNQEEIVQAHSPALDVGGLCSVGATVFMSKRPPGGKTSHAIELVLAPGPNGEKNDDYVLVGCHPNLGEKLAEEVLRKGLLQSLGFGPATFKSKSAKSTSPQKKVDRVLKNKNETMNQASSESLQLYDNEEVGNFLYKQRTYGDSRIDFELVEFENSEAINRALIEVKNVVCSDYSAEFAPEKTGTNHCVIISNTDEDTVGDDSSSRNYLRSGIFPWGRVGQTFEGKKVVSERAIKHLRNLSKLKSEQGKSGNVQTVVLFIINRSDCEKMRACHEACPVFASELKTTSDQGTKVLSVRIHWTEEGKAYFDGIVPVSML